MLSMADVFADPHYDARETFVEVADEELGAVTITAPVPRMSAIGATCRISAVQSAATALPDVGVAAGARRHHDRDARLRPGADARLRSPAQLPRPAARSLVTVVGWHHAAFQVADLHMIDPDGLRVELLDVTSGDVA